jgi:hypothetical protein
MGPTVNPATWRGNKRLPGESSRSKCDEDHPAIVITYCECDDTGRCRYHKDGCTFDMRRGDPRTAPCLQFVKGRWVAKGWSLWADLLEEM